MTANGREAEMARPDLPFRCACGSIAGELIGPNPSVGDHVVCHCTDCQAFATRLGAGDRVLDQHAGTALYQGRSATMRLLTGRDRLACMHLTDKPTLRWYARCCSTPMFNTYKNGSIPYITTVIANCDPDRRETLLGPPVGHLFTDEATGGASHLKRLSMFKLMRRFSGRMIADIFSGDRRRSELFDAVTLAPIASPAKADSLHAMDS